jgi:hypothetical protein
MDSPMTRVTGVNHGPSQAVERQPRNEAQATMGQTSGSIRTARSTRSIATVAEALDRSVDAAEFSRRQFRIEDGGIRCP